MKILVIIKRTPDTESKIVISNDGKEIDASGLKYVINPYDEYAIEEALLIKEKVGDCEVVIASFGPDEAKEQITKALAMGADRGILISNKDFENADSLVISKVLKQAILQESPDLVLCGKQGVDDDNMHISAMVAELLGWGHVNIVGKLTLNGARATCEREIEQGRKEIYDFALPAVIGANKSLNTPRYASVPGIMRAKRKPFAKKTISELGLDPKELMASNKAIVQGYKYPPQKSGGKVLKDEDVSVMVDKVLKLLREEAKVI